MSSLHIKIGDERVRSYSAFHISLLAKIDQ